VTTSLSFNLVEASYLGLFLSLQTKSCDNENDFRMFSVGMKAERKHDNT